MDNDLIDLGNGRHVRAGHVVSIEANPDHPLLVSGMTAQKPWGCISVTLADGRSVDIRHFGTVAEVIAEADRLAGLVRAAAGATAGDTTTMDGEG